VDQKAAFVNPASPTRIERMALDIGPMYKELSISKLVGLLPIMAGCSVGQLGALNAESLCERVLSFANNIVRTDNTLLDDVEVEMLVVLRMNRAFMEFMRLNYSDTIREQFGMTIVM